MTLEQARDSYRRHNTRGLHTPRLRLKPKASRSGHVDGAWWPRSDDLTTELPDLIAVLSFRLGAVDRVTYNLDEWASAPVELASGEHAVHLDGHHRQPPHTVEVQDTNRNKMVLLVVPLQTEPRPRTRHRDGSRSAEQLLNCRHPARHQRAGQGQPHTSNCRTRALGFTGSRTKR